MKLHLLVAAALTLPAVEAPAATKESAPPDKELLRMMDFLTDWEVIQQIEKMKEMEQVGRERENGSRAGTSARAPVKKKEAAK
jgi:hypothetical protein